MFVFWIIQNKFFFLFFFKNKTNFRTFDNREVEGTDNRRHDCHHQNSHAFGTLHKDQPGFHCGSMADPVAHNCRFEYPTDLPGRKFIQTKDSRMCKSKYSLSFSVTFSKVIRILNMAFAFNFTKMTTFLV